MKTKPQDKTNVRLKAVLDILAGQAQAGEPRGASSAVLTEAITRVPLDERESELLSGGVPRGFKALTTATSKLVKAGWLVKGRSGWAVTEEGLRAAAAFPDVESFTAAMTSGTPIPSGTPVPAEPLVPAGTTMPSGTPVPAGTPVPSDAAEAGSESGSGPAAQEAAPGAGQPAAVAIAGNFASHLGASENWAPHVDEAQMVFDPAEQKWKITVDLPPGAYAYKVAIDRSWVENYGAYGVPGGPDHELHHPGGKVTFEYDHSTKDVTTD